MRYLIIILLSFIGISATAQNSISERAKSRISAIRSSHYNKAERLKAEYEAFRKEILGKWGETHMVESSQKVWVEYSDNNTARSKVDFENGEVTIEVISELNDTEETIREKLERSITNLLASRGKTMIRLLPLILLCCFSVNCAYRQTNVSKPKSFNITKTMPTATTAPKSISTINKIEREERKVAVRSDVDMNIPHTLTKNENTFVVIIANQEYKCVAPVEFALNDGKIFNEYCQQTLGIPSAHIHHIENASLNEIRGEIRWLSKVMSAYSGKAKAIFYYAGHGIPDESNHSAYLLPVDGYETDVQSGYKLGDSYNTLERCPANLSLSLLMPVLADQKGRVT